MSGPSADFLRPRVRHRVRFAAASSMTLVDSVAAEERAAASYSKGELDRQRQQLKDDVRRMEARLSTTPAPSLPHEELYECVGLEASLSRGSIRSTRTKRHVRAVLAAQTRQRRRHKIAHIRAAVARKDRVHAVTRASRKDRDEEELAHVSRTSSEHSVDRAKKRAAAYWRVLE